MRTEPQLSANRTQNVDVKSSSVSQTTSSRRDGSQVSGPDSRHPPPVRIQPPTANPPKHPQSTNKLHRHSPNASYPPPVQHVSTHGIATRHQTQPSSQSQRPPSHTPSQSHVGYGENRGNTESGSHRRRNNEPEPEQHSPLGSKKSKPSWGGNLLKGMAKSIVTNAANEVVKDINVLADSSINTAFAAVGAPVNLRR